MMFVLRAFAALCLASCLSLANAGTVVNTQGSPDGVAIGGFDTVAFFTDKKAVAGKPELSFEWNGARWHFASEENLKAFQQDPAKWAPQYGGHCALGVSEGYISRKPTSGRFYIQGGKLYLFPSGTAEASGAYDNWWRGGGPGRRIWNADRNWGQLKVKLEADEK